MVKRLVIVCLSVVLVQLASCELRDQHHLPSKLEAVSKFIANSLTELDAFDASKKDEAEAIIATVGDFMWDIAEVILRFNRGIVENVRQNEHGKFLLGQVEQMSQLLQWCEINFKGDAAILKTNLKEALSRFAKLVPGINEILAHVQESTDNSELATNSITFAVDHEEYMFTKLFYHLKFRKYTNKQLTDNMHEVLQQAYVVLDSLADKTFVKKELVTFAHQLNYYIDQLVGRLGNWVVHNPEEAALKIVMDKVVPELHAITEGIQRYGRPENSLENLKTVYKLWLTGVETQLGVLAEQALDNPIVTTALFDGVGIVMVHKQIFATLADKN